MVFLSDRDDDCLTQARQVAEHLGVPTDSALKVLQALVRHDVLRSQLGRSGGYHLHRGAQDVTLLQIIEAIDGPLGVEMPLPVHEDVRWSPAGERLHDICDQVVQHTRDCLAAMTLAQLAANDQPSAPRARTRLESDHASSIDPRGKTS